MSPEAVEFTTDTVVLRKIKDNLALKTITVRR